jgi:TRAP-type C4-dicarboxylate transport system permease small subunit
LKRLEERVAVVAMALLVLITLGNVISRYFTSESFAWTEEISIALMVVMTLSGAAAAAARDAHIRIEYFYEQSGQGRRAGLVRFAAWVGVVFFVGLAILFARIVYDEIRFGETSMGLGVPRWWYSVWVPPLCLLIAWRTAMFARSFGQRPPPA